jgi:hypothetical protein
MADEYVYCHGTECHKKHTQDRIRGVKGSKVLRTKRIKQDVNSSWYNPNNLYNYFCSMSCYNDFAHANIQQIIAIAPRTEPLETPINVTKEKVTSHWNPNHTYVETKITECDNIDNGS